MKAKIVTAAALKPPRSVCDQDIDAICATFKIASSDRGALRQYLDTIADGFAEIIRGDLLRPDRGADRDRLQKAIAAIQRARTALGGPMGEAAELGLKATGRVLARW
jgi:hypothetical protein